jgi:hypothetical protein
MLWSWDTSPVHLQCWWCGFHFFYTTNFIRDSFIQVKKTCKITNQGLRNGLRGSTCELLQCLRGVSFRREAFTWRLKSSGNQGVTWCRPYLPTQTHTPPAPPRLRFTPHLVTSERERVEAHPAAAAFAISL